MADADGANQLVFENISPATRLLEKRRQMYEVQDALEAQKQRFAQEEELFKKKEVQLRAKDLQLQQQLIKFNKFLQDNQAKQRRAETRTAEEQTQIKQKDEEIISLQKNLEQSQTLAEELEADVTKNLKYEEFLELVKETTDDYSEIQDLVTRHETLELAHKDLMESQQYFEGKNEHLRNEYQVYKKDRAMEILALTNKTASLKAELEDVEKRLIETTYDSQENFLKVQEEGGNLGQIIQSIQNLFNRCVSSRPGIQHYIGFDISELRAEVGNEAAEGVCSPSKCGDGSLNATQETRFGAEDEDVRDETAENMAADAETAELAAATQGGDNETRSRQRKTKEKTFLEKKKLAEKQLRVVHDYVKDLIVMAEQCKRSGLTVDEHKRNFQADVAQAEPEFQIINEVKAQTGPKF